MLAYQGDAEDHGAMLAFYSRLERAEHTGDVIDLVVDCAGERMDIRTENLINSAGLNAPLVAKQIAGLNQDVVPSAHYAKGNYFTLSGRAPFRDSSTRCQSLAVLVFTSRSTSQVALASDPTWSG